MADTKQKGGHPNGNGKRVLGPNDVKRVPEIREYEFPGYEGVFRLKKMGWRELEEIQLASLVQTTDREGKTLVRNDRRMYIPRIVAGCWVDAQGERYLPTLAQAEELADADIDLMTRLYEAANEVNGLAAEVRAELGKDLSTAQTESGGSPSVSKS
jgi:hypothetical protein